MTFTSFAFLVFLPAVVAAYYLCTPRLRWAVLLLASCYFYMAFVPQYILVLFFLIGVDFLIAERIEASAGARRRVWLITGIILTVGVLFVFKYFNFFNANIAALARLLDWNYSIEALRLLLPLGLSFHVFQSLSYLIEVYRATYPAQRHLGFYALYVMFFPQLVAGPIERPAHLLPQLKRSAPFSTANLESGLRLMAWGFFKKLVIADQLAVSVDYIYGNAGALTGPSVTVGMVFFALQLYADFSGYTDIARGSARMLGIELVHNFKQPYFSRSIAEFWRRWHISLSSWFRDYFYYPLIYTAKRATRGWLYACIVITFVVTGLWHGAGWTFMLMGAIFGFYIVLGLVTRGWREALARHSGLARYPSIRAILQTVVTFILVCVAWVFFRSPDLKSALLFLGRVPHGWNLTPGQYLDAYVMQPFWALGIGRNVLMVSVFFVILLLLVEYREQRGPIGVLLDRQPILVRSFLYSSLLLAIVLFGSFASPLFIYFQF